MKFCETLKPGFYSEQDHACYYLTGKTSGNKWIPLYPGVPKHEKVWVALIWTCVNKDVIPNCIYSINNPTGINL